MTTFNILEGFRTLRVDRLYSNISFSHGQVVIAFHTQVFESSKLVHLLQGTPSVDRIFTVDEVQGTLVTRKLYIITEELGQEKWRVKLVSTKEEPHLVRTPNGVESQKKIGTHDGPFHCDDALACFMLKLLPEYKDAQIIR